VAFQKFKGKCTNCGKFGHKLNECCSKTRNSKGEGVENDKSKLKKGTDKSTIKCFSCGEMGHYKSKCPKNKSKNATNKQSEKEDTVLMMVEGKQLPCEDIWIADSAASTHIINNNKGLYDIKPICEPVKIGDGKLVYATKIGRLRVFYKTYNGEEKEFILDNIQYISGFWINLFILPAAISKGCAISNKGQMIVVEKNDLRLKFNEEIMTKNSFVCGIRLAVKPAEDYSLATVTMANCCRPIDIDKLHEELGHVSKTLMQKMAKFMVGCSKISLKLARVVPLLNRNKRTPTKKRRQGAICQASGYL